MADSSVQPVGTSPAPPPREVYAQRRQERQRQERAEAVRERVLGLARLGVFLAGLVVAALALGRGSLSLWWLALPVLVFSALLFWHERVVRSLHRARQAVGFYDFGLARLDFNWQGRGRDGARFLDERHPCAADLDLFGRGSLFELLCTARTRTGEDTLASWLKAGAPPVEVRARQQGVAELRSQLDLREDLALLGGDVPAGVDFGAVVSWGAGPPILGSRWVRWPILLLGLASVTCLVGWLLAFFGALDTSSAFGRFFNAWGSVPFVVVLLVQGVVSLRLRQQVRAVLASVERRGRDLAMLASVLARLEEASFQSPRLVQLHATLCLETGDRPSQRIAQLSNLLDLLNSRKNQLFAPVALLLMWGTQMAYAIEGWRAVSGGAIRHWLEVVGQFEALCSLAAFAYENPQDPFPEVVEGDALYQGVGLGHPLLPAATCVRNDLSLGGVLRVLIVSGSNMSGKSTFLRTVGVNAVLALAGGVVRAHSLRLSPLAVGATLRIQDSLQAGRSRFYAEILRVRQVVDLSRGPVPLLFLLDEIFAGTNSHDRRLGADAVVRGLVEAGAIGLVTTHDLSLTQIADELGERSANVHFADEMHGEEIVFDYRLRPGVVRHSNALALMRAVGLRV